MGVFEHFPYVNFHQLNLDWIIAELNELKDVIDTHVVDLVARAGVAQNAQDIANLTTTVANNKTLAHNEALAASNAAGNAQTTANNAQATATAAQTTATNASNAATAASNAAATANNNIAIQAQRITNDTFILFGYHEGNTYTVELPEAPGLGHTYLLLIKHYLSATTYTFDMIAFSFASSVTVSWAWLAHNTLTQINGIAVNDDEVTITFNDPEYVTCMLLKAF